jgi:hypothetical protein
MGKPLPHNSRSEARWKRAGYCIRRTAEFGREIEPDKGILVIKRIQVTFYLQLAPEGTGNSGAGARVS